MQARYYDPVIGRFYSNDPIGFREVHSFNWYAYGNNNPYKFVDPDGRQAIPLIRPVILPPVLPNKTGAAKPVFPSSQGGRDTPRTDRYGNLVFEESAEDSAKGKVKGLVGERPSGSDLQNPPAEGWEWKGNPNSPVDSSQGAWVNPETDEQIHNDLDTHQEDTKRGPHVTYTDEDGDRWDYFPNDDKIEKQ